MPLVKAAFVMHWIVESPDGTMASGKPPGAGALESALRQCPGNMQGTLGNPGKRYSLACRAVPRTTRQHRASTELIVVNCPKCLAIAEKQNASTA